MEYGSIERELHIDAAPAVVYEVITQPEHIAQWWGFEAAFRAERGANGHMLRERREGQGSLVVQLSVAEADPPRRFSFRWGHPEGQAPTPQNSFLVTFELAADGEGTLLRLVEAGFREVGWGAARLDEYYQDHNAGWDEHLPNLAAYAAGLVRT